MAGRPRRSAAQRARDLFVNGFELESDSEDDIQLQPGDVDERASDSDSGENSDDSMDVFDGDQEVPQAGGGLQSYDDADELPHVMQFRPIRPPGMQFRAMTQREISEHSTPLAFFKMFFSEE
ncbi:unnamed protein product, partial [Owenia fusiformis]